MCGISSYMNIAQTRILIAEDDLDDQQLIGDALNESHFAGHFDFVGDGEALIGSLNGSEYPLPTIILLDLNMPKMDGREVLREIKVHPTLRHIPVIILTTSGAEEDIVDCYKMGASSFIIKPTTFDDLVYAVKQLNNYWFKVVELPKRNGIVSNSLSTQN